MNEKKVKKGILILVWLVKGAGLAMLALVLLIAIGEGLPNPFKLPIKVLIEMLGLCIALAGIVAALWRQLPGGILIIGGMLPFYIFGINWAKGWVLHLFILIGVLNIICGMRKSKSDEK